MILYRKLILDHLENDKPALYNLPDEKIFTYSQLHELVKDEAESFRSYSIRPGQHVVIQNDNTFRTVISILACIYLELCFILIPKNESAERIRYIINDSQSRLSILGNSHDLLFFPENSVCEPSLTYILYTSGSTGRPKGVMAPEAQVIFCIDAISKRLLLNQNDRIMCCLPLSFDYGLYQLLMSLSCGASLLLVKNSGAFLQSVPGLMSKYKATIFPAMPAMLRALSGLLKRVNLDYLRCVTSTGDKFPPELIREVAEILPNSEILPMYGLTECKRVSIMPFGRHDKVKAGSCGLPLDGTKVHVDDDGELIVSGPNVMAGYWNDTELTERCFFDDPVYGKSLRSGDIFRIDDEGFLYFCGREKNILKVDGVRVSSAEIEYDIAPYIGHFADYRVIGIDDDIHGEKLIACVYSEKITENEFVKILQEISQDWPSSRKIHGVLWLTSPMPVSSNGKINIECLKAMAKENHDSI